MASDHLRRIAQADGASAYWRLGDRGPTVTDEIGAHHGVLQTDRRLTQGLLKSDPNLGVLISSLGAKIPLNTDFDPTKNFSFEIWVKTPGTLPASSQVIASNCNLSTNGSGFLLFKPAANTLVLQLGDGHAGTWTGPVLAANTVYQIIVTYNNGAQSAALYLNAVSQTFTRNAVSTGSAGATFPLYIGQHVDGTGVTGTWLLDRAAYYPTQLSAAQVLTHYNAGVRQDNDGPLSKTGRRFRILASRVAPPTPITIVAPPATVTFSAPAPQLAPRNRINAPAATVTFSAPAPQVQRTRIVAPAASVTFNAPAPTVKEKVRPPAALVTFSAARPAAFQGSTKIQVTPAALVVFSAPAPTITTTAPGIGALPAVSFTPGTSWAFVICDRFGKPISLISRLARNKQLVYNLNRPTQLTFTVPGDDPRVNRIHDGDNLPVLEPGARTVKAYRKEGNQWVLRFAGYLWDRNPAERDASSSVIDIAVTCYDPMQRLVARLCRGSAGSFATTVIFTSTSGSTIAKALVDRTIQYADAFANDLGIATTGTFQVTTPQTISYDQQFVAPALIQLCDTQTMDVIFQPVDRQNGILAVMGVVAQRGANRPSVIFGYDAFPHSAVGWNSSKSMDEFADDLTLYSGPTASGKKELSAHRTDATAKNTYGTYEDAQVLTAITNQVFLDAIADTEILLRKRPREIVGFTPIPEKSASPFLDWFLGDTVYTEASANTGAAISGLQRIYGFTLDITDGGFEVVSELRVSANAE